MNFCKDIKMMMDGFGLNLERKKEGRKKMGGEEGFGE